MFVPLATMVFFFISVGYDTESNDVHGLAGLVAFVGLISFYISCMFSELFAMGVETLILCYLADEEMFSPEERYGEPSVVTTLQRIQQKRSSMKRVKRETSAKATVQPGFIPRGADIDILDQRVDDGDIFLGVKG